MIDLHVHSNCSDGTLTPTEVVQLAYKTGLSAIALTDHDTVSGIAEAKEAARQYATAAPLQVISGTEISAAYKNRDIHILGLFVDETNEILKKDLADAISARDQRNERMAERFRSLGIPVTLDELCRENPKTVITRAHFAKFLAENHYVKSREEAFTRYLGYDAPCFVPREYMQPEHAIEIILAAGGIPVLAHPLLYHLESAELHSLITHLRDAGLIGLEVYYSSFSTSEQELLAGIANHYGLLKTGGTDFHGANKPNLYLGTGRNNNLSIPDSVLVPLCQHLGNC